MTKRPSPQIETIHGFRVLPASPITKGFERALRLLASRGFADPSCVIVKTQRGSKFGAIPVDGKYVLPSNHFSQVVVTTMRDQGIEPPAMPFVFAPGATTLFHEWGHHVDLTWSGNDDIVTFSTRWFSHFFEIQKTRALSKSDAAELIVQWRSFASELFADLFDDWMRGDKKPEEDCRDPQHQRTDLLDGITSSDVREKTYALFEMGLNRQIDRSKVRPDLVGQHTMAVMTELRKVMARLRTEKMD